MNMKITICDDNANDLMQTEGLLQQYAQSSPDFDFQIEKFSDSCRLYDRIRQNDRSDVYLLDIIMENKSGIDLGREIQKNDPDSVIIYVTSSDDFALDAYHVHAARYLLKPIRRAELFEAMDYSISHIDVPPDPVFSVKTKDGLFLVPYSKIEYIENVSRTLDVHLTDGSTVRSIFIRGSFDEEIQALLDDKSFLQVHKSYVVNLNSVQKLTSGSFLMECGKSIPVSRNRAAGVKKDYFLFISEQFK